MSHLNPSKSIHVSFDQTISTSYKIRGNPISTTHSLKNLGVTIRDSLNWNLLFLVRHTGSEVLYKELLAVPSQYQLRSNYYTSLIKSQVLHCSPVWRPYLIIKALRNYIEQL